MCGLIYVLAIAAELQRQMNIARRSNAHVLASLESGTCTLVGLRYTDNTLFKK